MKYIAIFSIVLFTSFIASGKGISKNHTFKNSSIIGICGGWHDIMKNGSVIGKYRNCWSIKSGSYRDTRFYDQQ